MIPTCRRLAQPAGCRIIGNDLNELRRIGGELTHGIRRTPLSFRNLRFPRSLSTSTAKRLPATRRIGYHHLFRPGLATGSATGRMVLPCGFRQNTRIILRHWANSTLNTSGGAAHRFPKLPRSSYKPVKATSPPRTARTNGSGSRPVRLPEAA